MGRMPLVLLADSYPLFQEGGAFAADGAVGQLLLPGVSVIAAYIGVSNGEDPAFFEMFTVAMQSKGIRDCRWIRGDFSKQDRQNLAEARLICLAGGDPIAGIRSMRRSGMVDGLNDARERGALMVGISAGAMQMGTRIWLGDARAGREGEPGLAWAPMVVDVHCEDTQWRALKGLTAQQAEDARLLGVPLRAVVLVEGRRTTWVQGRENAFEKQSAQ